MVLSNTNVVAYCVYVLRSASDGKRYVGLSSDASKRLREHNAGKVRSTRSRRPLVLVYQETSESLAEARELEKYFKTAAGRRYLESRGF